jgi:hypothetical protein
MTWIPTPQSSNIAGYEYSDDTQILTVEFNHGGRYNYYDVPHAVYEQMNAAGSKGQFLAQNIKNVYRYARL